MIDARESALNALLAWDAARQEVNRIRSERDSHRCTEASLYDYETGDPGQGPCWQQGDTEDMCDECKARQPFMEPLQAAVRKASELRQKMQRQAARLAKVGSGTLSASAELVGDRAGAPAQKSNSQLGQLWATYRPQHHRKCEMAYGGCSCTTCVENQRMEGKRCTCGLSALLAQIGDPMTARCYLQQFYDFAGHPAFLLCWPLDVMEWG